MEDALTVWRFGGPTKCKKKNLVYRISEFLPIFIKKLNATKCLKGVAGPKHFGFKEGVFRPPGPEGLDRDIGQ